MLRVTAEHRRARIARRHGLHPDHRYDCIETATTAMTALHATQASTPHLSLHARVRDLTVADVEAALYERRSIVKSLAMRRTLWIVTRDLLPAVAGSAGRRVADIERARLAKEAGGPWRLDDIVAAGREIVDCLTGRELSARQLREALPHLAATFVAAPGTKWSADVPTMTRLLTIGSAAGDLARGHNATHWRTSRPLWTSMATWLGAPLEPPDADRGWTTVVRHWLWTFGPGTEADLVWWLGTTKAVVRAALADVGAVGVELDGGATGWVLPDDTDDLTRAAEIEPCVALLPTLDPTTMGWREREFYLDAAHTRSVFDSAGNAGTTVWVDGRIAGCWVQDEQERVRPILLDDVSAASRRRLKEEVARLDEFLAGEHITNMFASPEMNRPRRS